MTLTTSAIGLFRHLGASFVRSLRTKFDLALPDWELMSICRLHAREQDRSEAERWERVRIRGTIPSRKLASPTRNELKARCS